MKKYEIMFIVKPTTSEEQLKEVVTKYSDILTKNGAKLLENKKIGQQELAYEVKKFKTGYYFLFVLEASDEKAIKEFDRVSLISDDIIRHLITKIEE